MRKKPGPPRTGLRMGELLALDQRDMDFAPQSVRVTASHAAGRLRLRSPDWGAPSSDDGVAGGLARIGDRARWTALHEPMFCGATGEPPDGSALRRHCKPGLQPDCGLYASTIFGICSGASPSVLQTRCGSCPNGGGRRSRERQIGNCEQRLACLIQPPSSVPAFEEPRFLFCYRPGSKVPNSLHLGKCK